MNKGDTPGVASVTGAGSGIGAAIAYAFAASGCAGLALLDINLEAINATREGILKLHSSTSRKIMTYKCDVADPQSLEQTFKSIQVDFGRLDYAVNCAGLNTNWKASTDCSIEEFDKIQSVNYRGVWLCSREELKIMKDQELDSKIYPGLSGARAQRGAIVNIASILGLTAMPNSIAYCASKSGVIGLTRCDALDYSPHRIRVNAVLPGIMHTPMTTADPELKAALEATVVQQTPLKRWGQPEEVADVVVFLCSNKASFVQGAAWTVDGGIIIT